MKETSGVKYETGSLSGLLVLVGLFMVMYFFAALASLGIAKIIPGAERNALLASSAVQSVLLFAVPALIMALFVYHSGWRRGLGLDKSVCGARLLWAIAVYAVSIPAMNQLIAFNAGIHFPSAEIDATLRQWEAMAKGMTDKLLDTTSIGGLASGVLVIGVLTGICEELFFRGALQGLMMRARVNGHIAVWTAAFIFSAAHFQFYGFLPRLVLGAFFGYLFLLSGSIWLPAILHAINNSTVVVMTWLMHRGCDTAGYEEIGVADSGFPVMAVVSGAIAVAAFAWGYRRFAAHGVCADHGNKKIS